MVSFYISKPDLDCADIPKGLLLSLFGVPTDFDLYAVH